MLMSSLRGRLFAGLTVFIVGTGLAAGYLAFRWAFNEAIELQDSVLLQVASLAAKSRLTDQPVDPGIDEEARLVVEELTSRADGAVSSARRPLRPDLSDGLQTVTRAGEQWRVFVRTRSDGTRVAVGQPTASRDEVAQDSALRTIVPLGLLTPGLMLLIGIVVDRSLRPLSRLAEALDAKQTDHLERLPTEGIPKELLPFVDSINRLLDRIATMFDRQRRFVADAAHELRSPITALSLQADNLDRFALSDDARQRMDSLRTGIRRTAHLLEQLLAFARYDQAPSAALAEEAFDRIVKEVVADLLPEARHSGIDLGFAHVDAAALRAEPLALALLARNLIDNAIRYTPEGGTIDVSLHNRDGAAVLQIQDSGPGIPGQDMERIFEPFFRGVRPRGDGTGLGLSIVRRIVDRYDGTIDLHSVDGNAGRGLTVRVTLPLADRRSGAADQR
ncbi:ATP-binding protein [Tardiphaga sp. 172_B4_N1_3]|uniref:ATP-binding protein n=1 Tax=Tardiphaga sp. 172_B4_N1_3 TaxID=3240787 RepID=UPI003F8C75D9